MIPFAVIAAQIALMAAVVFVHNRPSYRCKGGFCWAFKALLVIEVAGLAVIFFGSLAHGADYGDDWPLVEQSIDTIAVCHVDDGAVLIFFFDRVQGEWTCLDHRWVAGDMAISYDSGPSTGPDADHRQSHPFTLAWRDDSDSCHRLIRAAAWIESCERTSPLAVECDKPWHARLLEPGLAKARPK